MVSSGNALQGICVQRRMSRGCHRMSCGHWCHVFSLVKSLERLPKLVKSCSFPSARQLDQRVRTKQNPNPVVTESELVLLAARQANKLRDQVLGQGIGTLLGKLADREDGGCVSQRTVSPKSEGEGCGWLLQTSWCRLFCPCSCPPRSGRDVPVNLQQDKWYSLSCKFFSLYE